MSHPILDVRGLSISQRAGHQLGRPVLKDVSFTLVKGEILCVVGRSGAGKSLTALAAMGLMPVRDMAVTGGTISLQGKDLLKASPKHLRQLRGSKIAMVFQEPMTALNPLMTIGHQIEEVLAAHGVPERRKRAIEMLERVGFKGAARLHAAYPHQLSGGQRQRAMIAMALILNPLLLIADEPTTALDVLTQKQILDLLGELTAETGTAILYITHDMGVVADIADRVAVMHHGRIVETGAADDVLSRPGRAITRALVAAGTEMRFKPDRPAGSGEPVLKVDGLVKTYETGAGLRGGEKVGAVRGVSLALHPGRTLGIIGETGSGKSTIARSIVRLTDPESGTIHVGGTELTALSGRHLAPHRKKVQIVFQDPYRSLNPRRTIGQSIIEGPCNFGVKRNAALARARKLLTLVGLSDDMIDFYPHQFSGGERQRIALARALALDPLVLVADEPVSALDMPTQTAVLQLLRDVQDKTGVAIILITHDLRVAAQMCDEIALLRSGRIVESGPTTRVFSAPQTAYARALLNVLPGRSSKHDNARRARG